jgi:hypothetical protein
MTFLTHRPSQLPLSIDTVRVAARLEKEIRKNLRGLGYGG